jgi:hypothetical protein
VQVRRLRKLRIEQVILERLANPTADQRRADEPFDAPDDDRAPVDAEAPA